jgi:hypothetical protein
VDVLRNFLHSNLIILINDIGTVVVDDAMGVSCEDDKERRTICKNTPSEGVF